MGTLFRWKKISLKQIQGDRMKLRQLERVGTHLDKLEDQLPLIIPLHNRMIDPSPQEKSVEFL
jgi:hypothetical protein